MSMFCSSVTVVEPNIVRISVTDTEDENNSITSELVVENKEIINQVAHTALFPLEELEHGFYGEHIGPGGITKDTITGLIQSVVDQVDPNSVSNQEFRKWEQEEKIIAQKEAMAKRRATIAAKQVINKAKENK